MAKSEEGQEEQKPEEESKTRSNQGHKPNQGKSSPQGQRNMRRKQIQKSPSKLVNELSQESVGKVQTTAVVNLVNQAEATGNQWVPDSSKRYQMKRNNGNDQI